MATYGDETGLNTYITDRGIQLSGNPGQLLVQATDYLETLDYKGKRASTIQGLKWPRSGVVVDGVSIDSLIIPADLEKAAYAQCVAIDNGNGGQAVLDPAVKMEKVDVLEVEYQDGALSASIDPVTMNILRPYLATGSAGGNTFAVRKA